MSILVIKNQPVSIETGDNFNTRNRDCTQANIDYCQSVRPGDTTMFQMRAMGVTGNNLVVKLPYVQCVSGSTQPFESICLTGWTDVPAGSWGFLTGLGAFAITDTNLFIGVTVEPNIVYRVRYDITQSAAGNYIEFAPQHINLPNISLWGEVSSTVGGTGTFTAYFSVDQPDINILFRSFTPLNTGLISIDHIEVMRLTTPTITVQDSTGATVLNVTDLTYYADFIQAQFDWPDIAEGVYNICVTGIDDLKDNLLLDSLCLGMENGGALLQENGECILWLG